VFDVEDVEISMAIRILLGCCRESKNWHIIRYFAAIVFAAATVD
jgi:hypothetical protein